MLKGARQHVGVKRLGGWARCDAERTEYHGSQLGHVLAVAATTGTGSRRKWRNDGDDTHTHIVIYGDSSEWGARERTCTPADAESFDNLE